MKQRMQGMVMGMLVMALLFGTVTVFAATTRSIEVTFGNVRTTLFGQEFVVRDGQGLVIEPFVYNGRAYFPLETILHAMAENAQWNEATSTLNFGAAGQPAVARERTSLNIAAPFFQSGGGRHAAVGAIPTANTPQIRMGGITHTDAILYRNSSSGWGVEGPRTPYTSHNLSSQWSLLTGYIGHVDGSRSTNATFTFFGDGEILFSHIQRAGELPTQISIPVSGVNLLRVEVNIAAGASAGAAIQTGINRDFALVGFLE